MVLFLLGPSIWKVDFQFGRGFTRKNAGKWYDYAKKVASGGNNFFLIILLLENGKFTNDEFFYFRLVELIQLLHIIIICNLI